MVPEQSDSSLWVSEGGGGGRRNEEFVDLMRGVLENDVAKFLAVYLSIWFQDILTEMIDDLLPPLSTFAHHFAGQFIAVQ